MSFEENMTAFYMAFAEDKLEQMCLALGNMRLAVQQGGGNADAAVREEMLHACELKAESRRETALAQLRQACMVGQDVDRVLTAFFYCVELGAGSDAADPFAEFLAQIFLTQARASLERVYASKQAAVVNEHGYIDRNFYVDGMSEIMTGSTDIMNAVADVTSDAGILLRVLAPIHATCADITLEIVQMYAVDARMNAWERRAIDQARMDPSQQVKMEIEADESLQMVDLFLDELSFIIRIIMSYISFLKTVCDGLDGERSSGFQVKVQEFNGVYLLLERFYIFQSVRKATAIAEVQEFEANVFVSSIVEDVSFVVNKSFFRASQCMNYHTALSIVIAVVDALQSMYLPAILELPSRPFVIPLPTTSSTAGSSEAAKKGASNSDEEQSGVSFSDMLLQAVDEDLTRTVQEEARRIMTINSAFMSGEFVESFQGKVADFSTTSFPREASIVDCLPTHIQELTGAFHSIVDNEVQEVLTRGIRRRMQEVIREQMADKFVYVLTADQYDAFALHGSPLNKLIEHEVMKNALLRRYELSLCRSPFEDLVACFVRDLTDWVGQAFITAKKPFNDLGALQLEREVTEMLTRVSEFVKEKSLRGAFTKLFEIVLILNLMQPAHVMDYLDSVQEELSVDEMGVLLRMRVDFKAEEVSRVVARLTAKRKQ